MRVLCTLPNCAGEVTGKTGPKKFTAVDGGMLSEDLTADDAKHFLSIQGYAEWAGQEPSVSADGGSKNASVDATVPGEGGNETKTEKTKDGDKKEPPVNTEAGAGKQEAKTEKARKANTAPA